MSVRVNTTYILWPGLLLVIGGALLLCVYWNLPLELSFLGLAALGLFLYLAIRFPEWLLVAALFAPQWKTFWFLQRVEQFADLTVVILVFLAAGLCWRVLTRSGRSDSWDFRQIFCGQHDKILAFAVFAAIVLASYFYTSAPDYGGSKLARFILIGSFLLIAPFFLILTEADFRRFARIFVGFSGVTAIQLIGTLEMRAQDASNDITRIGAGWLMGMAAILVLFYPLARARRGQRWLFLLMLPLLIAGLMASAARGPIFALFAVVLIGVGIWLKQGRLRKGTALTLLLLFVAGIGGAYYVLRQSDLGKYSAKVGELETLFTEGASSGSGGKRLDFYSGTLAAIPNHALIGTGVGSWSVFYYGNDTRNYPHNLILEIAFEEGLIGLAAFLTLLSLVEVSAVRMLRASRFHFLALALMVPYCVLVSLFSGDLDDNRVLWLWIGVTLAIYRTIRLHLNAQRSVRRDFGPRSVDRLHSPAVPTFASHFTSGTHSFPQRGRT